MADTRRANSARAVHDEDMAERTLVIERVFKAAPEVVFRAWTDPAIVATWWGPEDYDVPEVTMEARPGGAWRTRMLSPKGEVNIAYGTFREIDPPRRLVTTWAWEQKDGSPGHQTMLEVTLEPAPGGTKLRLVQSVFQDRATRDGHDYGWSSAFNDLDRVLA